MKEQYVLPEGFEWDQAIEDRRHGHGLVTVVSFTSEHGPQAMGTGFIISVTDEHAFAITAAHVLKGVLELQTGAPRHNPTALHMFLPSPPPMKLDTRSIGVACTIGDSFDILVVEDVMFDEATDLGILRLGRGDSEQLPDKRFGLDESLPPIGSMVSVLSYAHLSTDSNGPDSFSLSYAPVIRVGRVLEHHHTGTRLCKGPCITTSIPVYSGMSGGPVFRHDKDGMPMKAFGLVCSDPDEDGPGKQDRSVRGYSLVALLAPQIEVLDTDGKHIRISMKATHVAGYWVNELPLKFGLPQVT